MFLPGLLAQYGPVDPESFESVYRQLLILSMTVPQTLLVVYVCDLRRPGSAARMGWRRPAATDLVVAALGLALIWVVVGLLGLALSLLPEAWDWTRPAVTWRFDRLELAPLALVTTLSVGYREEIFYRAYLYDRAVETNSDPKVVLGAGALVFAAGHVYQGMSGFVVSLGVGVVLALLYVRRRSLHGIAIAHGLYNLAVLLLSGRIGA